MSYHLYREIIKEVNEHTQLTFTAASNEHHKFGTLWFTTAVVLIREINKMMLKQGEEKEMGINMCLMRKLLHDDTK